MPRCAKASFGAVLATTVALAALSCASGPGIPKGPPPEYEENPLPPWMIDGGAEAGTPAPILTPMRSAAPAPGSG